MKNLFRLFTSMLIAGWLLALAACEESAQPPTWQLVWNDEFDAPGLPDSTRWNYNVGGHGWGNNELQYYTAARSENARVENG